jgi:hypothetical protein
MGGYYRRRSRAWNDCRTSYNVNLGRPAVKQQLLKLCRLDVLAVGLALLALAVACCSHHRIQERLNDMERIGIPLDTHPPVRFKPECPY